MEAIEQEFVPLLVYNNKSGRDAELLERYREPAWNNPVVRFLAADGSELVPRKDGVCAAGALAERMVAALVAAKRTVPGYLELAREELASEPLERAVLAMGCFWHGEGVLGGIGGVRSAQAAWLEGREVVELQYAPARIPLGELLRLARAEGCAERVWVERGRRLDEARAQLGAGARELTSPPRAAKADDHEYYLREEGLAWLPLTPLQRTRVNARLAGGRDPEDWLTPAQRALLERGRKNPSAVRDLEPPRDSAGLWSYRAVLEKRLGH